MGRRIRSREQYQDFLKCLNLFAQDIIAKGELQIMVQDILGRYPDLLVRLPASEEFTAADLCRVMLMLITLGIG